MTRRLLASLIWAACLFTTVTALAGGGYDFNARNIAQKLTEALGQPVVVENHAGANGNIGSDVVAKAPADGYTLLLGGIGPQALSVALYPKLPYDPERDLAPITLVAADNGSGQHFGLEQLKQDAGIDAVHVPYKGAAPLHAALLGGEIDAAFNIIQLPMPQVRKGELKALAIAAKRRSPLAPEIPTMAELGYAIDFDTWYGLHAETVKALQAADFRERAAALGVDLIGSTPEELAAHQRAEIARWIKVGKAANIKVD